MAEVKAGAMRLYSANSLSPELEGYVLTLHNVCSESHAL